MNDRTNDISFLLQLKGVLHAHFDITLCFTENKTIITSNNYFSWVKYTNNLHALRLAHSFPRTHGPARRSSMNEHLVLGPCKRKKELKNINTHNCHKQKNPPILKEAKECRKCNWISLRLFLVCLHVHSNRSAPIAFLVLLSIVRLSLHLFEAFVDVYFA